MEAVAWKLSRYADLKIRQVCTTLCSYSWLSQQTSFLGKKKVCFYQLHIRSGKKKRKKWNHFFLFWFTTQTNCYTSMDMFKFSRLII